MPTFDNTPPGTITPTSAAAYTNAVPQRLLTRQAFSTGGDFEGAVFVLSDSLAGYTFTAPYTGRLTTMPGYDAGSLQADIGSSNNVAVAQWATHTETGYGPGIIPAGTVVRIRAASGAVGDYVIGQADFVEDTSALSFPTTPPGTITPTY